MFGFREIVTSVATWDYCGWVHGCDSGSDWSSSRSRTVPRIHGHVPKYSPSNLHFGVKVISNYQFKIIIFLNIKNLRYCLKKILMNNNKKCIVRLKRKWYCCTFIHLFAELLHFLNIYISHIINSYLQWIFKNLFSRNRCF